MIKYIFLVVLFLWAIVGQAHDTYYYTMNPKALQAAITTCPTQSPAGVSCDQLKDIALRVNTLAYELRRDPQGYGHQVLALQETIGQQLVLKSKNPASIELQQSLDKNKYMLNERLAIIKWLESPGS